MGNKTVSMALTSLCSQTSGNCKCLVNVEVEMQKYFDIKLSVLPDLYAVFILGQDFIGQHKSICVKFGGKRPHLTCVQTDFSSSSTLC